MLLKEDGRKYSWFTGSKIYETKCTCRTSILTKYELRTGEIILVCGWCGSTNDEDDRPFGRKVRE